MGPSKFKIPFLADSYHKWNHCPASRNVYFPKRNGASIGSPAHLPLPSLLAAERRQGLPLLDPALWCAENAQILAATTANCPICANMFTKIRVFTNPQSPDTSSQQSNCHIAPASLAEDDVQGLGWSHLNESPSYRTHGYRNVGGYVRRSR
ncbi:hypothetical protein [Achromobacter xylosoxidans]|uniref:hypothetical protein n=1 Tax=Alcaligenes xylosoxydans xylosoxydans TaxID=85698 RepID=UPI0015C5E1C0|nr:hypothetical protein [Achromobacter xylosoxidans]